MSFNNSPSNCQELLVENLLTDQFAISNYTGTPDSGLFPPIPVHDAQYTVDALGCYPTSSSMVFAASTFHTPRHSDDILTRECAYKQTQLLAD
ncbi:hypothetical protein ACEPAH_1474 [Sanghuangporus vaninii]